MSGGICAFCGAPLRDDGSRTCRCGPRSSELQRVATHAAELMATGAFASIDVALMHARRARAEQPS